MALMRLFNTTNGKIILSIILGLGLSGLFNKVCKDGDDSCTILKGPSMKDIDTKVFKHKNKCYIYEKETIKCNGAKNTISIS